MFVIGAKVSKAISLRQPSLWRRMRSHVGDISTISMVCSIDKVIQRKLPLGLLFSHLIIKKKVNLDIDFSQAKCHVNTCILKVYCMTFLTQ